MSESLIVCPACKCADGLKEQSLRYTWQRVNGLRADGDAEDYDSFDYGDDVIVVGYSCICGWLDAAELSRHELERLDRYVTELRARMPRASGTA